MTSRPARIVLIPFVILPIPLIKGVLQMYLLRRQKLCFAMLLILAVMDVSRVPSFGAEVEKAKQNPVTLRVAVVMDAPTTMLAFKLTNNGDSEIKVVPAGTSPSHIVIEKPNGEEVEFFSAATVMKFGVLKPAQSAVWKLEMRKIFELRDLTASGMYRVYWKLIEWKDEKTKVEYKSNDVYLLIEDKQPEAKK